MTDEAYIALRALLNIARNQQIRSLSTLKRIMIQSGYQPEHIAEAISHWQQYEDKKQYGISD